MRFFSLLLASIVGFIGGYVSGSIFGYRAAVADYVENDARTIRQMAETMYESANEEDVPPGIKKAMEAAAEGSDDGSSETGPGFQ